MMQKSYGVKTQDKGIIGFTVTRKALIKRTLRLVNLDELQAMDHQDNGDAATAAADSNKEALTISNIEHIDSFIIIHTKGINAEEAFALQSK